MEITMKYTKPKIREIRKGIAEGEIITPEQESLLRHFGVKDPGGPSNKRVTFIQNQIDGILRKLTPKRK